MADKELRVIITAQDGASRVFTEVSGSAQDAGNSVQRAGQQGAEGLERITAEAQRAAVAAGALGTTVMSAFVVPIGMGAKAAWDQVSAVEQATLAFRAYESDVTKVNAVLDELIEYAQSDLGRLFQRQELFAAAQGLKVMGAETENLSRYVEIMGRSVAIGVGNWDELGRVIGRVGSTGRLAGEDFDMLTKMGYQLDAELRNQTITWEGLFDVLDQGIGQVSGQTDTIIGQLTMTSSALRALGQEFLGVNEASQFADGGLGSFAYGSLATTRELLEAMQPVARAAGESLAFLGGGAELAVDAFRALPSGLQTTLLSLVGGFGALTVGASATVLAFSQMSRAGNALRSTYIALGNTIRAHPILFIGSIVGGLALSAWARHRSEVEKAKAAYEDLESSIASVNDIIRSARLAGDFITAFRMEALVNSTRAGVDMWTNELNRGYEAWGDFVSALYDDHDAARAFIDTDFFTAVVDQYQAMSGVGQEIIDEMLAGNISVIEAHLPGLREAMGQYYSSYLPSQGDKAAVEQEMEGLFELLQSEFVDSGEVMAEWNRLYHQYVINAERPNFQGFIAEWQEYSAGVVDSAGEIIRALDGLTEAQRDFRLEMLQMRLDGDGAMADDLESIRWLIGDIGQLSEEGAAYVEFFIKNIQSGNLALSDYSDELFIIQQMYRNGIIDQQEYERQLMLLTVRAAEAEIAMRELASQMHGVGSEFNDIAADAFGAEIALRNFTQAVLDGVDAGLDAYAETHNERVQRTIDNLNALIDVAGYGDPLSRWNLEGNATAFSTLAMEANNAANSLDSVFRVTVSNTNAFGSQIDSIYQWAEALIAAEGTWSKLDDLVIAGRIEGTIGDFTDGSEYALAQQAFNSIAEDNLRLQESILTIQAKQAPLIAQQVSDFEELMYQISEMEAEQQLITLGWMDSASAMRAMEFQTLAYAASIGELGKNGEEVFTSVITGAAMADPLLKAMLIDMGLISEGAEGEIIVNFDSVSDGKSEIALLIESINALIETLGGVPPEVTTEVNLVDNASGPLASITQTIAHLDGQRAVTYVETIFSSQGQRGMALGGVVQEYASGGVVIRAGEVGPEIAHFANGGTALLPRDGLYSVPVGSYITPNHAVSNGYGGVTVNISGNTFHNTSREEMNTWAKEDLLPEIRRATADLKVGMGVHS